MKALPQKLLAAWSESRHSIFSFAPVNCAMPTNADRTADYKGFIIRTFKTPNGSWRAIITKADGSKIKAAGQNESFDMIPIPLDSLSAATKRLRKRSG